MLICKAGQTPVVSRSSTRSSGCIQLQWMKAADIMFGPFANSTNPSKINKTVFEQQSPTTVFLFLLLFAFFPHHPLTRSTPQSTASLLLLRFPSPFAFTNVFLLVANRFSRLMLFRKVWWEERGSLVCLCSPWPLSFSSLIGFDKTFGTPRPSTILWN